MSKNRSNMLLEAYYQRDLNKFQLYLNNEIDVEIADEEGWTVLFYAARDGENAFIIKLIEHGANINAIDKYLRTPLHLAAQEYHVEAAHLLIQNGAKVDPQDIHGNTPLSDAVFYSHGRPKMIELLLALGANKLIKNKYGISPLDLAETISNFDVKTPMGLK